MTANGGQGSSKYIKESSMGKIEVTVQTEDRMQAISNLAIAIRDLADALNRGTQVVIKDCVFNCDNTAIYVKPSEDVTETIVQEIPDSEQGE